jgi:hypothetical protein
MIADLPDGVAVISDHRYGLWVVLMGEYSLVGSDSDNCDLRGGLNCTKDCHSLLLCSAAAAATDCTDLEEHPYPLREPIPRQIVFKYAYSLDRIYITEELKGCVSFEFPGNPSDAVRIN